MRSHCSSSGLTTGVCFRRSIFSATDRNSVHRSVGSSFVNCGKEDGYQN